MHQQQQVSVGKVVGRRFALIQEWRNPFDSGGLGSKRGGLSLRQLVVSQCLLMYAGNAL